MHSEKINAIDATGVSIGRSGGMAELADAHGRYVVECLDADGNVKWTEEIENLVVTAGKNNLLDNFFAGSAYTAAFYLGLVDGGSAPTYAAADTMASHAGWTENTGYSNSTRPAVSWNAASAGSKASSAVSFNINATGTIAGAFLTTNSAKSGTSGTLYSAGSFTGGNRSVASGDTLNVTYTASV
jgi:hypothetical protein